MKKLVWMIAVAGLALPFALQAQAPKGEEDKVSEPAKTSSKKDAAAKPAKMSPQEQKIIENTGKETRTMTPPKKMTAEEKKADIKAKRTGVTPEEEQRQKERSPGS